MTDQIEELLGAGPRAGDDAAWQRAAGAFTARAVGHGLADVTFERHDTPLGPVLVVATADGVVRIGLPTEPEEKVVEEVARRISARVLRAGSPAVAAGRRQLDEYFSGDRTVFDLPLDWRLTRGFRHEVLVALGRVPYGQTVTYAELAAAAGRPRAVRATGTALATNPIPIIVPCHRVLRTGGALGNYRGGAAAKAQLIALERGTAG